MTELLSYLMYSFVVIMMFVIAAYIIMLGFRVASIKSKWSVVDQMTARCIAAGTEADYWEANLARRLFEESRK